MDSMDSMDGVSMLTYFPPLNIVKVFQLWGGRGEGEKGLVDCCHGVCGKNVNYIKCVAQNDIHIAVASHVLIIYDFPKFIHLIVRNIWNLLIFFNN